MRKTPQSNKSTSATHLTNLTIDISQLQKQLQAANTSIDATAQKAVDSAKQIKNAFSNMSTASGTQNVNVGASLKSIAGSNIDKSINQIEKLALAYARFVNQMQNTKVKSPELNALVQQAKGYEQVLNNLIRNANILGTVTPKMAQQFQQVSNALAPLQRQFEHLRPEIAKMNQQYKQMEQTINTAVRALQKLERNTVSENGRRQVKGLSDAYKDLANNLRNLSVSEAQAQLATLNNRFENLSRTVPTATSWVNRFVEALTNRVRWTLAYGVLNTIFTSFSNLIKVIRETEDSVIELQRVLNNPPAQNVMADELNEIAYEYGQTFANVQEVAIRFAQTGMSWNETIEATRSTMLGLNTAELEVDTATQGLIAVMAQFNLEASDLEEVIDKVNITADNFPVTSEKIVAALQRAGGTASAFGMTLEETIGTITALSKATGRSGEAIGTAMNSLISFTMKESSLETFANYFSQIEKYADLTAESLAKMNLFDIWTKLGDAIEKGDDQLAQMLATSEDFKDLLNEDMASAIGLTDEYNAAVAEVNQQLANQEDIYSTVGVYRKNYFIALLNNIGTADEAIRRMNNAIGYSRQENETAMQALSKQFNQLVIAARELAVQFGEAGFLDVLKNITAIATGILKLTKNLGGLRTIMFATMAIMISIKRLTFGVIIKNITNGFKGMLSSITVVNRAMRVYQLSMAMGKTSTQALGIALAYVRRSMLSLGGVVAIITAISTVWGIVENAISSHNEALEEARQQYISTGEEATEQLDKMYVAYKKLEEAQTSGNNETLRQSQIELAEALGYTAQDLAILAERAGSLDAALDNLIETEYRQLKAQVELGAESTAKDFEDITEKFITFNDTTRESVKLLEQFDVELSKTFDSTYSFAPAKSYQDAVDTVAKLDNALAQMEKQWTSQELATNDVYKAVVKFRGQLSDLIEENKDLAETSGLVADTFEGYVENMDALNAQTNALLNGNEKAILSFEELQEMIDKVAEEYDNLSKKVDSFQSAYSTLTDAITEYNETGIMTADMLQSLLELEPQYLELLDTKNGVLAINDEKLGDLINANDTYMEQLMALKIAEDAETWALTLKKVATEDMTEAEIKAALASVTLSSDIAKAAYACLTGASDADTFTNAIKELGTQAGLSGDALDLFASKVSNTMQTMSNLRSAFSSDKNKLRAGGTAGVNRYVPVKTTSRSSGGGSSKSTSDVLKEELNERLEVYEHSIFLLEKANGDAQDMVAIYRKMQEEIHNLAEKYRSMGYDETSSYIMDLQEKWWSYQDKIVKLMDGIYDATVKAHENALSLLENQYNQLDRFSNYAGMTENLRKQYDIQRQLQEEAHKEAQRLRQMGVDENDDAIQACIKAWWAAEDAIQEINSKIEKSILDTYDDFISMVDKFNLWEYMDFSKVDYLYEKLNAVNDLFTEGTISLKEYNAQLKELGEALYDAQVEQFEKEKEDIQDYYDKLIKKHKEEIKSWEKEKDRLKDYYDTVVDGYKLEIEAWEKKKDEVEEYYDKLIENLRDVQEENERINKQVDYYNERQKILTNLEQAQARSGVAWREKEMEYQQQLIDLDEDWRRTQEEWNIEDQIKRLEELRALAVGDIDATIDKINQFIADTEDEAERAIANIDNEIAGIESTIEYLEQKTEDEIAIIDGKISELSQRMAEAIKNGTADGLVDVSREFDQATRDVIITLGGIIAEGEGMVNDSVSDTARQSIVTINDVMFEPMKQGITEIADLLKTSIVSSAETAAKNSMNTFRQNLVQPLQDELKSAVQTTQATQAATTQSQLNKTINTATIPKGTKTTVSSGGETTNVFINQTVGSASKGLEKAQALLQKLKIRA